MKKRPLCNMGKGYYISWYLLYLKSGFDKTEFYLKYSILSGESTDFIRSYVRRGIYLAERLGISENQLKESPISRDVVLATKIKRSQLYLKAEQKRGEEMKNSEETRALIKKFDKESRKPDNQEKCLEWYSAFVRSGEEIESFMLLAHKITGFNRSAIFCLVNNGCYFSIERNLKKEELLEKYKNIVIKEVA